MARKWGGQASRKARVICAPLAAAGGPCYRCKKPILPGQEWHPDHIISREMGGGDGPDNLWPSHAHCNTSAGGKRGARITNARKAETNGTSRQFSSSERKTRSNQRERGIRGL